MPLMELGTEQVTWSKQALKGTPAATPQKRGRKVGGDIAINPGDGSENWSDGERLSSALTFMETLVGEGSPVFQLQPGIVAHLAYLWCGQESVTGTATNNVQTATITGTPDGGTATVSYDGLPASPAAFDSTAAALQAILEQHSKIGKGNVTCGGGPWPGSAITITFVGELAASPHPLMTATHALTGGTTPNIAIVETTAGVAVEHVATPASTSFWTTFWKQVGSSVSVKERYADCRISGLTIQAGREQLVGRVTPQVFSLDPGENLASLPAISEDVDRPFVWTEAGGVAKVNGVAFTGGLTGLQAALTDSLTPQYAQSPKAFEVASGVGQVQGSDIGMFLDAEGLKQRNRLLYGTESPAAAAKPILTRPATGSFELNLWRFNTAVDPGRQVKIEFPNVEWSRENLAVAGNPDGGAAQVQLSFTTVKKSTDPHVRITTRSASPAFT